MRIEIGNRIGDLRLGRLVTRVYGPYEGQVGETLTYTVESFNLRNHLVSQRTRDRVRWVVRVDGENIELEATGETLELEILPRWDGREILVMAYIVTPVSRVGVRTAIQAERSEFLIAVDPGHFIGSRGRRTPQMPDVIEDDEGNLQLNWESVNSSLLPNAEAPHEINTPDSETTIVTADGVVTPSGWNASVNRDNPAYGIPGELPRERFQMREWEFNNAVAVFLIPLLRNRGYSVLNVAPENDPLMSIAGMEHDNGVHHHRRVRRAHNHADDPNEFGREANFYLSIHADADADPRVVNATGNIVRFTNRNGIRTYHPPANARVNGPRIALSQQYARIVQRHLMINGQSYDMEDRGISPPSGVHPHVLTHTEMPSVLIEAGFFTNFRDAILLMDDAYRRRTAERLLDAVDEIYREWRRSQNEE